MDWNEDGLDDLIVGDWVGHVNYFQRITADSLTEREDIQDGGGPIDVGDSSAPDAADYDDDGLPDLIIGIYEHTSAYGSMVLYLNQGSPGNPVFDQYQPVRVDGMLVAEDRTTPRMVDLNQDGRKDLVYGERESSILYCENVGTSGAPLFAEAAPLQTDTGPLTRIYATLCASDWNGDGYTDLIIGEVYGRVFVYLATPTGMEENDPPGELDVTISCSPCSEVLEASLIAARPVRGTAVLLSLTGREVRRVFEGLVPRDGCTVRENVSDLPRGVYVLRFATSVGWDAEKVVLLD